MITEPLPHVRAAARALVQAGATLVAGHSAHVSKRFISRCAELGTRAVLSGDRLVVSWPP